MILSLTLQKEHTISHPYFFSEHFVLELTCFFGHLLELTLCMFGSIFKRITFKRKPSKKTIFREIIFFSIVQSRSRLSTKERSKQNKAENKSNNLCWFRRITFARSICVGLSISKVSLKELFLFG